MPALLSILGRAFAVILPFFLSSFIKRILVGAGLTLATSGITLVTLNTLIDTFKDSLGVLPSNVLGLAHVAGFDYYFSIILGAYVSKYVSNSSKLFLKRATKK